MKGLDSTPFEAVRVGIVSSIDRKKGTARVYFGDREDAVSYELKVVSLQTMKNKHYWMPDIDETVICLFLANGHESGYVLGSVYSNVDTPPTDKKEEGVWYEDGTVIKYDMETKTLTISCKGKINIHADDDITVTSKKEITHTSWV